MAHVPEGRRVFPSLSVLQNLKLGAYTRKDKDEIKETLEMVYSQMCIRDRSGALAGAGRAVSDADKLPGDVVCYYGHVGIYIGNNQDVYKRQVRRNQSCCPR